MLNAILIISIFLLLAASLSILRLKRSPSPGDAERLPPEPQYRGLFDEGQSGTSFNKGSEAEVAERAARERRADLLARAAEGDRETLRDAHDAGDASLYRDVLDALARRVEGDAGAALRGLSAFIARSDALRSSPAFAGKLLEFWAENPEDYSITEVLRIAALSDDAGAFQTVVEKVFEVWSEGRLHKLRADELDALFESEYWLLSSDAKRSGAGFVLKRTLAELRRRLLESARPADHPTSDEAEREKASH
ncbi:MAG: hypothetical protein LC802_11530 [Acidobacteria bacterium]|nr:hypothetical protein [Acidobacteriota bacterium]